MMTMINFKETFQQRKKNTCRKIFKAIQNQWFRPDSYLLIPILKILKNNPFYYLGVSNLEYVAILDCFFLINYLTIQG